MTIKQSRGSGLVAIAAFPILVQGALAPPSPSCFLWSGARGGGEYGVVVNLGGGRGRRRDRYQPIAHRLRAGARNDGPADPVPAFDQGLALRIGLVIADRPRIRRREGWTPVRLLPARRGIRTRDHAPARPVLRLDECLPSGCRRGVARGEVRHGPSGCSTTDSSCSISRSPLAQLGASEDQSWPGRGTGGTRCRSQSPRSRSRAGECDTGGGADVGRRSRTFTPPTSPQCALCEVQGGGGQSRSHRNRTWIRRPGDSRRRASRWSAWTIRDSATALASRASRSSPRPWKLRRPSQGWLSTPSACRRSPRSGTASASRRRWRWRYG